MIPAANLTRLCSALPPPDQPALTAAAEMPLSRAHGPAGLLGIAKERRDLWTAEVKRRRGTPTSPAAPACTESWLHTDDCVFFYLAGFGYPETEAGFLFRQSIESDLAFEPLVSPFDSGSLWSWHDWPACPPAAAADEAGKTERAAAARAFLAAHSLPAAGYREYLARILSHRFITPSDYLRGREPSPPDTHGLSPCPGKASDRRRWTFEMRIPVEQQNGLPLPSPHLEAVFLRTESAGDPDVMQFVRACRLAGAEIIPFRASSQPTAFQALQRAGIDYLETKLTVSLNP